MCHGKICRRRHSHAPRCPVIGRLSHSIHNSCCHFPRRRVVHDEGAYRPHALIVMIVMIVMIVIIVIIVIIGLTRARAQ
jgi:hypothetical protein